MISRRPNRWLPMIISTLGLWLGIGSWAGGGSEASISGTGASTALEALRRLKGLDLEANPAVKQAVLRTLELARGTSVFVEIVRDFGISGQEAGLIEVAEGNEGEAAALAVRLLLEGGQAQRLEAEFVGSAPSRRAAFVRALADSADRLAIPLLVKAATESADPVAIRSGAVRGLARTEPGARELLRLGREGKLDEALHASAALALGQSRWAGIREEARLVFPSPRTADGAELPPIEALVELRGDAVRGALVFGSEHASCLKCHRVGNEGVEFGPALTEIGSKLARQALYESILDPSAGVSFGYEGWTVTLKDGDEIFGLLVSETPDEIAIKLQGGVVMRVAKEKVAQREREKLSVMPAGLGQLLTRQDLVDLVEYLASLKGNAHSTTMP